VSAKYLLPCRCGQNTVVEPRQAGETVVCPCGQTLPIPTLLEMAALEAAPAETPLPSRAAWGSRHGLMFLGAALVVVGMGFGIFFHYYRPIPPIDTIDPETIRQGAKHLPPAVTWRYWRMMKQGLDRRTDQKFADDMTVYYWKQGFAAILTISGFVLIVTAVAKGKADRNGETRRRGEGETRR
jgi:hypothetical protein